jgi:hypothetical protein
MKKRLDYLLSLPDGELEKELENWTLDDLQKMLEYMKNNVSVKSKI